MTQKEKIMAALDVSADEAEAILKADAEIDKGKDLFPLDAEQRKVEKKMRQADRKKNTVYNFQPRERKKNEIKGDLISEIAAFLTDKVENLTVPNAERVIAFEKDGKRFEITLTQKRKQGTQVPYRKGLFQMKKITERKFFNAYRVHCNGARLMGLKPYNIFHFWYCWRIKWRTSLL